MAAGAGDASVSEEDDPENAQIAEQVNKDIFDLLKMGWELGLGSQDSSLPSFWVKNVQTAVCRNKR